MRQSYHSSFRPEKKGRARIFCHARPNQKLALTASGYFASWWKDAASSTPLTKKRDGYTAAGAAESLRDNRLHACATSAQPCILVRRAPVVKRDFRCEFWNTHKISSFPRE